MRKVELMHVEVLNETEQMFAFRTFFNKKEYGDYVIINTVRSIEMQDTMLAQCIRNLETMKTNDATESSEV